MNTRDGYEVPKVITEKPEPEAEPVVETLAQAITKTMSRDDIRKILIGNTPTARSEIITIFGVTMEMRQPPLSDVLGTVIGDNTKKQVAYFVINYCYMPGTTERIFESSDEAAILKWPFGPDFMRLQDLVTELMGVDVSEEEEQLKESPLAEQS